MSLSTCTICMEKFRYNDSICSCCRCTSKIHYACWLNWKNTKETDEPIPCPQCQQYGVLYTDSYTMDYYIKRAKKRMKKIIGIR